MIQEIELHKELNNQEPFKIRGHHLKVYRDLIKHRNTREGMCREYDRVWSPEECANRIRSGVEACLDKEYVYDVLGFWSEDSNRFTEQTRKTFERFLNLPNNYPVEIVEEMPDNMCKACIMGEHCHRNYSREGGELVRERKYLNLFLKTIKDVLYLPKPSIAKEEVCFIDSEKPHKIIKIKTTMDITRNVLAQSDISFNK